jgi:4-amino-4-deoxy-L-arabinose transferase-like glycosyltransferase
MLKSLSKYSLILVVLLSVCLQLFAAYQKSFWEDEAFVATFAGRGSSFALEMVAWDYHPPLYMLLASGWGSLFGYNELGLRLLSIIFSELTLFLCYLLAHELLGRRTALAALTLLAFSPLFLMFGFNARYYSLAAFLALAVVLSMWKYARDGRPLFLLLYILSSVAFLYLLFAALVVIAVSAAWWVLVWLRRERKTWLDLAVWIMAQALVLLAYLPGMSYIRHVLGRAPDVAEKIPALLEPLKRLLYMAYVYALGETISPLNPLAWIGGLALFSIAIYAILRNRRKLEFWLPVSLVGLIVAAGILVSGVMVSGLFANISAQASETWQNLPARAFYVLPFLAIWLGAGLVSLPSRWFRLAALCILVVYSVGITNYFAGRQYLRPVFAVPWREMFEKIQDQTAPGALVICGEGDHACLYYSRQFGFGGFSPPDFDRQFASQPPEAWLVQNNLSLKTVDRSAEQAILDQLSKSYASAATLGFGEQDPGIRRLKSWFLKQDDYQYRVVLYHFYNP